MGTYNSPTEHCPLRKHIYIFVIAAIVSLALPVCADELELQDGRVYKGTIVDETTDKILISIESYGTLSFDKSKIKEIRKEGKVPVTFTPEPASVTPLPATQANPAPILTEQVPATPSAHPSPLVPTVTLTPTPPPPDISTGYDAVLFGVVKDVRIKRPGSDWTEASDGTQLKINDEIMTSEGKVKIKLRGRGELRLPPHSHLILKSMSPDGNDVTIDIRGGAVWNNVTPAGGMVNYRVQTPDLTAGVRGTLFKVEVSADRGSRVAVFEGIVETISTTTQGKIELEKMQAVTVDPEGSLAEPVEVDPKEREEWDYWDEWALEVHKIALRFPIGGQTIDNLAKLHAQDMKRYEAIVKEANENILTNREADKIESLGAAFEKFYSDTGVIPTVEQGFKVLAENPGIDGWKGPYYLGEMPPKDRWDNPLYYVVETSPVSGNTYGKVISAGPNGIYSKGSPATDDIAVIVKYYAINRD